MRTALYILLSIFGYFNQATTMDNSPRTPRQTEQPTRPGTPETPRTPGSPQAPHSDPFQTPRPIQNNEVDAEDPHMSRARRPHSRAPRPHSNNSPWTLLNLPNIFHTPTNNNNQSVESLGDVSTPESLSPQGSNTSFDNLILGSSPIPPASTPDQQRATVHARVRVWRPRIDQSSSPTPDQQVDQPTSPTLGVEERNAQSIRQKRIDRNLSEIWFEAIYKQDLNTIRDCLERLEVNTNLSDATGRIALDYAKNWKNKELIQLLKKHGAKQSLPNVVENYDSFTTHHNQPTPQPTKPSFFDFLERAKLINKQQLAGTYTSQAIINDLIKNVPIKLTRRHRAAIIQLNTQNMNPDLTSVLNKFLEKYNTDAENNANVCSICLDPITQKQATKTCRCCANSTHLECYAIYFKKNKDHTVFNCPSCGSFDFNPQRDRNRNIPDRINPDIVEKNCGYCNQPCLAQNRISHSTSKTSRIHDACLEKLLVKRSGNMRRPTRSVTPPTRPTTPEQLQSYPLLEDEEEEN